MHVFPYRIGPGIGIYVYLFFNGDGLDIDIMSWNAAAGDVFQLRCLASPPTMGGAVLFE